MIYGVNTAVILAAGMGTRLRGIIGEKPKGLLKIEGKELILHSIEKLKNFGVRKILLITGYKKDQYVDCVQTAHSEVEFVVNTDFAKTGSMHSLFLARNKLNSDFLLLESDLYYENRALSSLLKSSDCDRVLISGKTSSGDEVYVYGENEQIHEISKKIIPERSVQGELVGISKVSLKLFQKMCEYYSENITYPSDYHYEDCFSDLSKLQSLKYLKVEDLVWTEIDDPSHYKRAINTIVPKVHKNDSKYQEAIL